MTEKVAPFSSRQRSWRIVLMKLACGLTIYANMENLLSRHWHSLPRDEIETLLESNAEKGLDMFEVAHRQKNFGSNRLPEAPPRGALMRLLAQFHNLLIYVLLGAALIAIVILGVVLAMIGVTARARPAMLPAWAGRGGCAMNQCRAGRDSAATGTSSVNSLREERPI